MKWISIRQNNDIKICKPSDARIQRLKSFYEKSFGHVAFIIEKMQMTCLESQI